MAFPIVQAAILFAAAVVCIFFRYKDNGGFGSLTGGLLLFILAAFLWQGLSYETGARITAYQNFSSYTVAHSCTDPRNESWLEYEVDSSDCGANPVTETVSFLTAALPVSDAPVIAEVQPDSVRAVSMVCFCASLLFMFDGFALYTRR